MTTAVDLGRKATKKQTSVLYACFVKHKMYQVSLAVCPSECMYKFIYVEIYYPYPTNIFSPENVVYLLR